MAFNPREILLSLTDRCNLSCPHCDIGPVCKDLDIKSVNRFILECRKAGLKRIGFTGGESFLAFDALIDITKCAVGAGYFFTRIMTNGVWHSGAVRLREMFGKLKAAGYDGDICVSVDAYHRQNIRKLSGFITAAQDVWGRPDIVSIAYVDGRDIETKKKLVRLAGRLGGRLKDFGRAHPRIRSKDFLIKIYRIGLSPAGKASRFKSPYGAEWFKCDRCRGPGNIFFVDPSGDIKPCCGYASSMDILTIGRIGKDSASDIIKNIRKNRFVYDIFKSGLGVIRRRLIRRGVAFPGKIGDNCFFCRYVATEIPSEVLNKCLKG